MSDDAAQKRCDVCDKRVKTDKRTQSGEQEVCEVEVFEVFTNPEERKEGEKERRVKRELRERDKEVEKDVMDWTRVTRDKRQGKRTIQIFVKVDGSRAITMEMALSDKVSDVAQRSVCVATRVTCT